MKILALANARAISLIYKTTLYSVKKKKRFVSITRKNYYLNV